MECLDGVHLGICGCQDLVGIVPWAPDSTAGAEAKRLVEIGNVKTVLDEYAKPVQPTIKVDARRFQKENVELVASYSGHILAIPQEARRV